ncbi:Mannose-1-phosphate guanyltransferase alpha [Morella rubra]|uniref:Mannose-1-phosphate guanyltransferase alpha n=1 Tax=Morella rubra TaxID=262757 RepID=A0A6A1VJP7_9ROSI|nr:Mannose-1-phosphate guanyltransferase alpha [Morella rubra]
MVGDPPKIPNLAQIFLIGFYQEQEFALYVSSITNELKVPVRYLKEDKPHGSAAGLYYFRDMIQNCAVYYVVVLICAVIRKNGEPLRCILITSISFGAVTYLSAELRCLPQFFKNGEFGEFTLCMMYVKLACDLVTGHI